MQRLVQKGELSYRDSGWQETLGVIEGGNLPGFYLRAKSDRMSRVSDQVLGRDPRGPKDLSGSRIMCT